MITTLNKFKQFINENIDNTRVYLLQNGTDGFGYVMGIHLKTNGDKIGSVVFRKKQYLKDKGYPYVLEIHIGFENEYQKQGFFQDTIIELLKSVNVPVFVASGRVINSNVFKAISNLDKSLLNINEIDVGFIITLK